MLPLTRLLLLGVLGFTLGACASRPLPKYEKPLARAAVQQVRTTAYTHTESDHRAYGRLSAAGTPLKFGSVRSAAADWSRWPKGTIFRVVETGEIREVDDYGWALSGTNTIDFYQPSRSAMNAWGVRRVNIEILRWGDAWQSHSLLRGRSKHAHVKRMLKQIEDRYPRGGDLAAPVIATVAAQPAADVVSAAPPASRPGAPLQPFYR